MTGRAISLRAEAGFTLIEVTVAGALLLVGLLGTVALLTAANTATVTTKAREQAVALQREIVEGARSLSYDTLSPSNIVSALQALPHLDDEQPGTPGWQIRRRGVTYSVAVGACSVDDPGDGAGAVDAAAFCASTAGTPPAQCRELLGTSGAIQGTAAASSGGLAIGNCGIDLDLDGQVNALTRAQAQSAGVDLCALGMCPVSTPDTNPDDYKRIVTLVRWNRGAGSRYALQSTTLPNPGMSGAPQVATLTTTSPTTVTAATSIAFDAITSRTPASVLWSVDGNAKGAASGASTAWTFNWSLGPVSATSTSNPGEVLDGTYVVGAKAFDAYGEYGATRSLTINLNRRVPYAPVEFAAGRNAGASGGGGVVDFEWSPNRERDVVGYRIYRAPETGSAVQVCPATAGATTSQTACQATGQPADPTLNYFAVAVDRDTAGSLREGDQTAAWAVTEANTPPADPGTLSASVSGGNTVLSWTGSAGDPDVGDSIAFYRIYRDGTSYEDRYDRTGTGNELTFPDTRPDGVQHTYRIVAVDTQLAESAFSNAVTR